MSSNEMMKKGMKDLMKKGLGKKSTKPGSGVKPKGLDLSMFDNLKKEDGKAAGGMMKKKGYKMGGMTKKGYKMGGMTKKGMAAGGMMKKKGMAKGGMTKKGYKKGGKVRGVGIASKGFRPAKMVTMSKGGKKGGKK